MNNRSRFNGDRRGVYIADDDTCSPTVLDPVERSYALKPTIDRDVALQGQEAVKGHVLR